MKIEERAKLIFDEFGQSEFTTRMLKNRFNEANSTVVSYLHLLKKKKLIKLVRTQSVKTETSRFYEHVYKINEGL